MLEIESSHRMGRPEICPFHTPWDLIFIIDHHMRSSRKIVSILRREHVRSRIEISVV